MANDKIPRSSGLWFISRWTLSQNLPCLAFVGQRYALPLLRDFPSPPPLIDVTYHVRRLPHWRPPDADFFVTWRLYGSLPMAAHGAAPQLGTPGEKFVALDRQLDRLASGPLLRPLVPLRLALMNIKSASARAANAVLKRTGNPFWQDESYDHWVRNERERSSLIRYIHCNPVAAGLVSKTEEWPWSTACPKVSHRANRSSSLRTTDVAANPNADTSKT